MNLTRLTDTDFVLPSALYACSRLPEEELLDGATHSDGTVDHLCPDDLELCKRAREHFAQMLTNFVHKTFPPSHADGICQDAYSCAKAYEEIREDALIRWSFSKKCDYKQIKARRPGGE
ncbi:hypothetical protein FOMPIDRAFT_86718 [Fomitopsis schrenkii]|uniref:Uncharacterized protein n=1 Tax=Fomitopsis schrenkii TaxID=2126942 RepID=S8FXF4_FOMSC|nr:hypothetical protein FOMPIDRAFT_86718 [Fomitopsis schrenkii]